MRNGTVLQLGQTMPKILYLHYHSKQFQSVKVLVHIIIANGNDSLLHFYKLERLLTLSLLQSKAMLFLMIEQ